MTHGCSLCTYTTNRRYNLERHINTVHFSRRQNVDIDVQNVDIVGQNVDIAGQNVDMHKCPHCYKSFSCARSLNRHAPTCKHVDDPSQCWKCRKRFSDRTAKSRHIKTCKGVAQVEEVPSCPDNALMASTGNGSVSVQNIGSQNNIHNQQNIHTQNNNVTNNVMVLKFPDCDEDFDFHREHISQKKLNAMWDCSRPEIGFYKYAAAILENPKNRYVRKTDAKANHSSIHVGDGEWELAFDKDVLPRFTFDMSVSAKAAYNDNKKKLKLAKTSLERIFQYLDNVNTENDPDFTDALQRLKLIVVNQTKKWERDK